jgi:predicted TIM-barrel fold metal-dependent hydrolase
MVIDFHAHIYPDKIAAKAVLNIGAFYTLPMAGDGTVDGLLRMGFEGRIDRFVVFSAAAIPGQVRSINDYIAGVCAQHGNFTGFGTMHPGFPNPAEEIERLIGLGLKGIKLHPDMQKFCIDDERMMDVYALLEEKGLPIVFHTGDYRYHWSEPARLAKVLDRFPHLKTVAAHFGGWSVQDLAVESLKDRVCGFDVSSSIPFLGRKRAVELIRLYGADRFLFGSDYPMWDPGLCREEFMRLELTDEEKEKILYKNALNLLGENV